jgi:hypothetical protein
MLTVYTLMEAETADEEWPITCDYSVSHLADAPVNKEMMLTCFS